MHFLTLLSTKELIAVHNAVAKTPVTKFRDRKTGEGKVSSLTMGMGPKLLMVLKKVGVNDGAIKELEVALVPPPPPAPKKAPQTTGAHPMLKTIYELIKNSKKGNTPSSADVAELLGVKPAQVCAQCDLFAAAGLINIEDDSTSQDDKFYYLHITASGLSCEIADGDPAGGLVRVRRERVVDPNKPSRAKVPSVVRAPRVRLNFEGLTIHKLVKENPRMKGSARWLAFEAVGDSIAYDEFIKAGGIKKHIIEMVSDLLVETHGDPAGGLVQARRERVVDPNKPSRVCLNFEGLTIHKLVKENPRMKGSARWLAFEAVGDSIAYDEFIKVGGIKKHIIEMVSNLLVEVR